MKKTYSSSVPLPFSLGGRAPSDVPVIRSARKSVSLELKRDGTFLLRAPLNADDAFLKRFLAGREDWLRSHLKKQEILREKNADLPAEKLTAEEIRQLADAALADFPARAARFAPLVGVTYGRITIRNQNTRWGSWSSAGNLNFNCLLMLTPPEVLDSVVVHELCHLKEMNHSARFYAEVIRVFPEYRKWQKWLKDNGEMILARLAP